MKKSGFKAIGVMPPSEMVIIKSIIHPIYKVGEKPK
jgi:hypothetical protein